MGHKFKIQITLDRKLYRLNVEQMPSDTSFLYFKVIAGNGTMLLKNNQPVLDRHNLKYRRPTWTVVSGEIHNTKMKELIFKAIEQAISS